MDLSRTSRYIAEQSRKRRIEQARISLVTVTSNLCKASCVDWLEIEAFEGRECLAPGPNSRSGPAAGLFTFVEVNEVAKLSSGLISLTFSFG